VAAWLVFDARGQGIRLDRTQPCSTGFVADHLASTHASSTISEEKNHECVCSHQLLLADLEAKEKSASIGLKNILTSVLLLHFEMSRSLVFVPFLLLLP
jgi:hypothetical protein